MNDTTTSSLRYEKFYDGGHDNWRIVKYETTDDGATTEDHLAIVETETMADMLIAMAWRNLWRHGRRTFITASALAVSLAFVMAMLCFMDGMFRKMSEIMVDQATGHLQIAHPNYARARYSPWPTWPDMAAWITAQWPAWITAQWPSWIPKPSITRRWATVQWPVWITQP